MEAANTFHWHHTKLRVKDATKSISHYKCFYSMTLLHYFDLPKTTHYFMASLPISENYTLEPTSNEAAKYLMNFTGTCIQLVHTKGTEDQPDFKYHPGNTTHNDKLKDGFGHIAFHVPNLNEFCEFLEQQGVRFKKKPHEGNMKTIAFAYDEDDYWVEIIARPESSSIKGVTLGQTMLRIKDPKLTLKFYQETLGMKLIAQKDMPQWKFSLFFLVSGNKDVNIAQDLFGEEAFNLAKGMQDPVLELTHNHGTEDDADFKYMSGNEEGFLGLQHISFMTEDAAEYLQSKGVEFTKLPNDGQLKGLAFAKDPDGYMIELLQKDGYSDKHLVYFTD